MKTHPFKPLLPTSVRRLLVGTLPPEDTEFYFSHSPNTRLWDILKAISENAACVETGANELSKVEKLKILSRLNLGISDIIYGYERDEYNSTKDVHILPLAYNDILKLATDNNVTEILFVYQSAYKWFLHSLTGRKPVRLQHLEKRYSIGVQELEIEYQGKKIKCVLLPSPLNRGRKGETMKFKLKFYGDHILPNTSLTQTAKLDNFNRIIAPSISDVT